MSEKSHQLPSFDANQSVKRQCSFTQLIELSNTRCSLALHGRALLGFLPRTSQRSQNLKSYG